MNHSTMAVKKNSRKRKGRIIGKQIKKRRTEEQLLRKSSRIRKQTDFFGISLKKTNILDNIFSNLDLSDRNNVRLVSKFWYNVCNLGETAWINIKKGFCFRYLLKTGFVRLKICFVDFSLNECPFAFWHEVGPKIHSLKFIECQFGYNVMKNLILLCDNLQSLDIVLKDDGAVYEATLCCPLDLEAITVVRKQLKSLKITRVIYRFSSLAIDYQYHFGAWKRIFTALCRIFPNVIHTCSQYRDRCAYETLSIRCTFSKDSLETDESNLGYCLASILWDHSVGCTVALKEVLSNNRLTAISLNVLGVIYSDEYLMELGNLITNHKNLTSSELQLHNYKTDIQYWKPEPELLEKMIFSMGNLSFMTFNSFAYSALGSLRKRRVFSDPSISLSSNHVQHLFLNRVSDRLLQCIFQCMTNLKTLKVGLSIENSNFGMTGCLKDKKPILSDESNVFSSDDGSNPECLVNGHSISQLQDLEELIIYAYCHPERAPGTYLNDVIYKEFKFPKLYYLRCFPPKDPSIFNLPSLREIYFPSWSNSSPPVDLSAEYLSKYCRFTKNLHTLHAYHKTFSSKEVKRIFKVCPSLRILHTKFETDFYEPFTKEIRRVKRVVSET